MVLGRENSVMVVVGARPNFVKMAPVVEALGRRGVRPLVVHTGQHYDEKMSSEVLSDLGLPAPDRFLGVGSGRHGAQTGRALEALEDVLVEERPELLVVGGDVNSTLAAALAAAKLGIPVAHVEAGLRSGDWTMPEEVNRVLTDRLSDLLFTHSPEAGVNLVGEGIPARHIHYVGNTMIDSLVRFLPAARGRAAWQRHGVREGRYTLVTLHRPSNVDVPDQLLAITHALAELARRAPVLFPVHPRTRARLAETGSLARLEAAGVRCLEPHGYLDFLSLEAGAGAIVTDSGGVQEESSALGVPCYTLRPNTERPVTVAEGTNVLLGDDPRAIRVVRLRDSAAAAPCTVPLWDGRAAERTADVLVDALAETRPLVAIGA